MGMFDDVNFEYRMPDGFDGWGYQTKDFDCTLDVYTVTPGGRLYRTSCSGHRDDDGREDRPIGDLSYDGTLNIYTSGRAGWREYDLVFTQGNLVEIRCHKTGNRLVFEPLYPPSLPASA